MNRFSVSVILLVISCTISNAIDPNGQLATASTEETTDTMAELYEPNNSEEAFDPQKEYAELNKLYKLSGPSLLPQYLQQQQARSWHFQSSIDDIDNDEMIASTINSNNRKIDNEDDEIINTTTFPPSIDAQSQHTTIMPVNSFKQMESLDTIETSQNTEMLGISPKHFETTNPITGNANTNDEFGNHVPVQYENRIQHAPVFFKNDANSNSNNNNNNNNDYGNQNYVIENHDNHEVNNSQPITLPYSVETTIASFPSSPIFIPTRPPYVLYTTSSTPSNAVGTPSTFVSNDDLNSTLGQTNSQSKKSAKKIEPRVYKYSADEIIRKYLDDTYIRAPLATLINTAPEPLRKAKMLWKSALRPNTAIDIVLVAFNSSGVGVTYSFKNTRTMIAGLESVQESHEMLEGGSGFYGILRASELVPYDSAIFISTDKIPQDISLMKNAATILLKKRIRLYLIWFGVQDIDENETSTGGVLGEVALRSGGEIFRITEESLGNGDVGLVTHFLQNDIQGAQVLDIPVNTTTTNLHIEIQGNVEQATLITPNGGDVIDLLNKESIVNFSRGSFVIHLAVDRTKYDHHNAQTIINLNVMNANLKGLYTVDIQPRYHYDGTPERYSLFIRGDIQSQRPFKYDVESKARRLIRSEQLSEAIDDIDEDNDNDDKFVWPANHRDNHGNDDHAIMINDTEAFERSGKNRLQSLTKIELGLQSQLLPIAGSTLQIHYEITNLRDIPTYFQFQVVDEQRFLRSLNPPSLWLPAYYTQTVVVTCHVPSNIEIGTKDRITFTAKGTDSESQSAILTVSTPQTTASRDRTPPKIHWNYGTRCYGRTDAGRCAGATWSVEITTADWETGILRITSNPKGLLLRERFTAGSTEEVKATYSASCCAPRVTITSHDLAGNQKTISLDVTEYILGAVEIAAITLGAILLLIIIVAIIVAIVYCVKKRRNSRDLPVYRGRAERDRSP